MNASTRHIAGLAFGMLLATAVAGPAFAHGSAQHRFNFEDGSTMTYDAATDQYCWKHAVTGSLLLKKECHTQTEWAKLGLNVSGK